MNDDKNNITFLDNECHPCTPSGFAVEHMRNINKILNCSPETTSTNGWDTCEIVNEENLARIPSKSPEAIKSSIQISIPKIDKNVKNLFLLFINKIE